MSEYKPRPKAEKTLNEAMAILKTVKYTPSLRWLFYQLLQRGTLSKTKEDLDFLTARTSNARKRFWNGWNPLTLYDSVREPIIRGIPTRPIPAQPDRIKDQKYYVEIWFEAMAMFDQFDYYTKDYHVTLVPFRGDLSIYMKADTALRLTERHKKYKKPIVILYFGDCDKKGKEIPDSALKDIRSWCTIPFTFIYCGLTLEQAKNYKLPVNPEKPDKYQWEALPDEHAKDIILSNLKKYWKKPKGGIK